MRNAGARMRRQSRWLHAVSADLPTAALPRLRRRPECRHLQPVARFIGRPEEPTPLRPLELSRAARTAQGPSPTYGAAQMQMRRLDLFPLANQGLRAAGVTIALLDTGFETELPAFDSATVSAQWDFVFNDSIVRNEAADTAIASRHGTSVWSLLAANVPDTMVGVAPDATYLLAKTEDIRSERRVEEDNFVAALEWADSLGASIITTSLGYLSFDNGFSYTPAQLNGDVAVTTVAADMAAQRGIFVTVSVGNQGGAGFRSLVTPADGDSVIAVGAEDSLGTLAGFSARGPTADGRLKPDFVAPGRGMFVVDPLSPTGYGRVEGTSFSAPLVAGTAALMKQLDPTLQPMTVRTALREAGSNVARPDSLVGWGRPDGAAAAVFPAGLRFTTPADSTLPSPTPEFRWNVPTKPVFIGAIAYHLVIARDSALLNVLLDTTVTDQPAAQLLTVQLPGERVVARLSVQTVTTVNDTIRLASPIQGPFTESPWTTLLTLDDPAGTFVRDLRPVFSWTSPVVPQPPGPFTYDVTITRDDIGQIELETRDLTATTYTPPRDLERNTPYRWRVVTHLGGDSAITRSQGTFVILDDSAPTITLLFQNFPNPFPNPGTGTSGTCIWFDLAVSGAVRLDVLDVQGHIVKSLVPGGSFPSQLPPGRYGRPDAGSTGRCDPDLAWDGTAANGARVPRGIYLIRLRTPDGIYFRRMVFLGGAN